MPKATVGEVDLYYEIHGEGPPLLMINGLGASVEMWSPFWKRLATHYQVILFDNRGVGRSQAPAGRITVRAMADDSAGLLDSLGVDETAVYGASMGGMIAQELALDHPRRVRALLLGMTTAGGPHSIRPEPEVMQRLATVVNPPSGTSPLEVLWSLEYSPEYLREHRAELLREAATIRYPTTSDGYRRQAEAALTFDSYDRLPEIRAPTLVMAGTRDVLMPPKNARIIAERIPGARLRLFDGAGHGFTREKSEEATVEILRFLEQTARPIPALVQ